MAIETGLRTLLLAQSSITAIAAAQDIDRISTPAIWNENPPQKLNPPYVLISVIQRDPLETLTGTTGLMETEIDIDCYAVLYAKSVELATAVSDFLKDYTGAAGASDTIKAVNWKNTQDDKIWKADGTDVRLYYRTMNFRIHHQSA